MISRQSIPAQWSVEPAPNLVIRGDGPPVLLLHGWGASVDLFAGTIAGLEQHYTLIAPDFPGFGGTAPPSVGWSVGDYTAWIAGQLDDLGVDRCAVVGHSFGGSIAIALAVGWPTRVTALVLAGAAGIRPAPDLTDRMRIRKFKAMRALSQSGLTPAPLRRRWQERVTNSGSADYRAATGTVRESFVRVVNEDLTPMLSQVSVPTLLIWGDQDGDTPPEHGRTMERLIPDAGLVIFPGAGHYAYLEQSPRFCHIVTTFFQGLPAW